MMPEFAVVAYEAVSLRVHRLPVQFVALSQMMAMVVKLFASAFVLTARATVVSCYH